MTSGRHNQARLADAGRALEQKERATPGDRVTQALIDPGYIGIPPQKRLLAIHRGPRRRSYRGSLPGAARGQDPERFRVSAGHGLGLTSHRDCQSVRIYSFEQRPQQDSNLRTRLRRVAVHAPDQRKRVPADLDRGRTGGGPLAWAAGCA